MKQTRNFAAFWSSLFAEAQVTYLTFILLTLQTLIVVFNDIRVVSMTVCWHHLLFQFSNFEFPNLAIYLDAAN
jgi:hypothetical protein